MKSWYTFAIVTFLLLFKVASADSLTLAPAKTTTQVYIIPLHGDVEPAMASFLSRSLTSIKDETNALIIIEMDTFGGRVDAALEIVDTLLFSAHHPTIAYVKTKAISAGALISLSCKKLYMKKGTTIGDCAPLMMTNEGPKMLGEKFQSPLRAKFRALAKQNNYPSAIAESMVSDNMLVYKITRKDSTIDFMDSTTLAELSDKDRLTIARKNTVVSRGKLLTMNDDEAHDLKLSQASVSSIEEVIAREGITNYTTIRITESWSEKFVRWLTKITPILLIIGFGALYIEFKSPGFGLPGILGIAILALVFLGQFMVGLANYSEILLFVIGVLLIGVEMFVVPGTLIAGSLGVVAIGLGILLSLQNFVIPSPSMPWQKELLINNVLMILFSLAGALFVSFSFVLLVLPRLGKVFKGPYLSETLATSHADSTEIRDIAIGAKGVALSLLRPAGKARVDNRVFDVTADGSFIEKDAAVRVTFVSKNKITVTKDMPDVV